MKKYKIKGSVEIESHRVVERAETCSHKAKATTLKQCGYNNEQRKRILEIKREMRNYSTTC